MKTPLFTHSAAGMCWFLSAAFTPLLADTALEAVKLLPEPARKQLARIEGREGTPHPERWYLLVHDDTAANHLREFVVSGSELAAAREISQFAESLKPADVLGDDAVQVDSDTAAQWALLYAEANDVTVVSLKYHLEKKQESQQAVWKVSCMNEAGAEAGFVTISADDGTVLAQGGFPKVPVRTAGKERQTGESKAKSVSRPNEKKTGTVSSKRQNASADPPSERIARVETRRTETRRAEPVADRELEEPPPRRPLRRIGQTMRRLLPF